MPCMPLVAGCGLDCPRTALYSVVPLLVAPLVVVGVVDRCLGPLVVVVAGFVVVPVVSDGCFVVVVVVVVLLSVWGTTCPIRRSPENLGRC